jgi:radical SAM protein with 4Fe4S-binding SPASM domain
VDFERNDSWALPVLSAWPKVMQIVKGEVPTPEVVEIFPTNYCNFHCPHCRFKHHHAGASAFMSFELIQRLLAELAQREVRTLELSGGGEPLVHPHIAELFDCFIQGRFKVGLITNGYAFVNRPDLQEKAARCCSWIRFSIDAFSSPTYRRVHGGKALEYGGLRRAIMDLRKRASGWPQVGVKILISKLNATDVPLAISEAARMGVDYLQLKFLGSPQALALNPQEIERISDQVREQMGSNHHGSLRIDFLPPYLGAPGSEKCLMTFLHPVIDWDGEVYVCAFFEHRKQNHSLGNIRNRSFFDVWESSRHRLIFERVDPNQCVPNCPMRRYNPLVEFMIKEDYRREFI